MLKKMLLMFSLPLLLAACKKDEDKKTNVTGLNPDTAPKVSIDRFSANAGKLMVRNSTNGLPQANKPINFDAGEPFITKGLAADGRKVEYYNFDVQSTTPAPIWLFVDAAGKAIEGQLNVINAIPGDAGYSDFWQVNNVTVPGDYVVNSITSLEGIQKSGYTVTATGTIVNCPVVPEGSTAQKRFSTTEDKELVRGWYKNEVVFYFSFFEKILQKTGSGAVPVSPIYVTFNINPDPANPASGPASGFVAESGSDQTHNVIATLPSDAAYSPLWNVNVYDNADFAGVSDLSTATKAKILATNVANVNCPVVAVK